MARGAERRVARVVGLLSLSLASGCTWGVTRGTLTPAELVERVPEGKLTCVAHPPTGPRVRRVLMVGIDGLRPDALEAAATPNLDRLRAAGWYSLEALGEDVSKSGPVSSRSSGNAASASAAPARTIVRMTRSWTQSTMRCENGGRTRAFIRS